MTTLSVPPPPRRGPRLWRFTWEALAHMPALRLFLFSDDLDPSSRCAGLRASLSLEESLLLVNWSEEGAGELALRVPLPKALIDPVSAIHCVPRGDHIEVKLAMVLPLDHPMSVNLSAALVGLGQEGGFSDCTLPLSVNSDLERLSAGDIHLYCRTCSTRLTRTPPRNFIEMPSADWRDVADNWFGSCCCSFGGASEKLVHKYIRVYNCSKSTCLLDGPSVVISKDDLDGYAFQKDPGGYAVNFDVLDPVAKSEIHHTGFFESSFNGVESLAGLPQNDSKFTDDLYAHGSNNIEAIIKTERSMNWNKSSDAFFDSSENQFSIKQIVIDKTNHQSHACGEKCNVSKLQFPVNDLDLQRSHFSSIIGSLGSGFLTKASNLSNDVEWVEFLCRQCSSFLGSYARVNGINNPVDGGVRLFKCCISTSSDPCGTQDIFRKYTFQKIFVSSLLESAAYELSFRTIVRDLRTKSPMLRIIILNSKAWCATGSCFENEIVRCFAKLNMRPVVKVLFSDLSEAGPSSSATQGWITDKNNAEEVYVMPHQTKELATFLKLAHESLPPSCSSFEGMSLSYIER